LEARGRVTEHPVGGHLVNIRYADSPRALGCYLPYLRRADDG